MADLIMFITRFMSAYTLYGKKKLLWPGSKEACEVYSPKADEVILTAHRFYANKQVIPRRLALLKIC